MSLLKCKSKCERLSCTINSHPDQLNALDCNECQRWVYKQSNTLTPVPACNVLLLCTCVAFCHANHSTFAQIISKGVVKTSDRIYNLGPFIWLPSLMTGQVLMMMETKAGSDQTQWVECNGLKSLLWNKSKLWPSQSIVIVKSIGLCSSSHWNKEQTNKFFLLIILNLFSW